MCVCVRVYTLHLGRDISVRQNIQISSNESALISASSAGNRREAATSTHYKDLRFEVRAPSHLPQCAMAVCGMKAGKGKANAALTKWDKYFEIEALKVSKTNRASKKEKKINIKETNENQQKRIKELKIEIKKKRKQINKVTHSFSDEISADRHLKYLHVFLIVVNAFNFLLDFYLILFYFDFIFI